MAAGPTAEDLLSLLRERQAQLQDRIDRTRSEAERMYSRMAADKGDAAGELSSWAEEKDAPKELRDLRMRVRRGEFTWQQVIDREVDDPAVRSVFRLDADVVAYTRKLTRRAVELMETDDLPRADAVDKAARELDA